MILANNINLLQYFNNWVSPSDLLLTQLHNYITKEHFLLSIIIHVMLL
jgi:hypothetical protein